jgi:sugar fermentation stimulation protein A
MRFSSPLIRATLQRRYKRFLADVTLPDGSTVVAHCPNPGSMLGIAGPGMTVWLSRSDDPRRKLAHCWEIVEAGTPVGVNTGRANAVAAEAIAAGTIAPLAGYAAMQREVRCGDSRLDFLLTAAGRPPCYVEVKSVTLRRRPDGPVEFPDAVTARGARHLSILAGLAATGVRAVLLFLAQRNDGAALAMADDIDPAYAAALDRAQAAGAEVICYGCEVTPEGISVARPLPLVSPGNGRRQPLQTAAR